jgi:hypothetical protein
MATVTTSHGALEHPTHEHGAPEHPAHEHGALEPAAACASVALDIGAGSGALILYPSERFRGREIEISRIDGHGHRVHTGVHERTTHAQSRLTAVFGCLPSGEYVIWEDASTDGPVVSVPDGGIAELALG